MDLKKEDTVALALFAVFVVGLSLFAYFVFKPSITGFVVYSPEEYVYDNTKVNISDNQIKLIPLITETSNVTEHELNSSLISAVYNNENNLDKVNEIDDDKLTVKPDKLFNIVFDNKLDNEDKIIFYMKKSKASNIHVCNTDVECNGSYGSASYDGEDGIITIALNGLSNAESDFSINNDEDIKIDYITATYKNYTTQIITTISYSNGSIEINDLIVNNISSWDSVLVDEILNGQEVNYYYSTNSGNNWNLVQNKDLSLASIATKKIKIKAELLSNGVDTPILSNLVINYTTKCNENWICNEWSSCINETKTRVCEEMNGCGTYGDKPDEAIACYENATRFTRVINFNDINAEITVVTNANISNILFNLANSSLTLASKQRLRSLDIKSSENIQSYLLSAMIKINYNESELGNIEENTLSLYYYNETSSAWEKIESLVNTTGNYITANLTHFSVYGIFGDAVQPQPSSSSSSSSGSGGGSSGGSSYTEIIPIINETKDKKLEEKIVLEDKPIEIKEQNKSEEIINTEGKKIEDNIFKRFTGFITKTANKQGDFLKKFSGFVVRVVSQQTKSISVFLISFSVFIIFFVLFHLFRPR